MKKKYKSEDDLDLSEETKEDIKKARKEIKEGKLHTLDEIKKKLKQ